MPAITPPLDANVSLVTGFMQAVWGDANSELIDHYVGAGFVDHAYTPHDSSGHANMVRVFSAAFSGAAHRLEQCVAQGDMVMLQLRVQARHSGQFRDIAATGKAIDVTQYRTFRVADGRIVEHWALFDTASLLRQLQPELVVAGACALK
jgi:predicted ester cyclase